MVNIRSPGSNKTIEDFCRRWQITELALFGSALSEDSAPAGDIDILAQFSPEAEHSLFDMVQMEDELREIFGKSVDLISRRGIELSRNPIRRQAILDSAKVIYAA